MIATSGGARRRPRPVHFAAITLALAGGIVASGHPTSGAVWFSFGLVGTALTAWRRRARLWPFWALVGLITTAAGALGQGGEFAFGRAALGLAAALSVAAGAFLAVTRLLPGGEDDPLAMLWTLCCGLAGIETTRWHVREGRLAHSGARPSGGSIVVPRGFVVATRRGGEFARLIHAGQGRVALERDETPHRALPLGDIQVEGEIHGPLTRDAVRIDRVVWAADYRLHTIDGRKPAPGERHSFDPYAARQAAWAPEAPGAVRQAAADEISAALRQFEMSALFATAPGSFPLEPALTTAHTALAGRLAAWGLDLLELRIRHIDLPDEVQGQLVAMWQAECRRRIRAIEAESPPAGTPEGDAAGGLGEFVTSLRRRAEGGDQVAAGVLAQLMGVVSRLEEGGR